MNQDLDVKSRKFYSLLMTAFGIAFVIIMFLHSQGAMKAESTQMLTSLPAEVTPQPKLAYSVLLTEQGENLLALLLAEKISPEIDTMFNTALNQIAAVEVIDIHQQMGLARQLATNTELRYIPNWVALSVYDMLYGLCHAELNNLLYQHSQFELAPAIIILDSSSPTCPIAAGM
jgi:hypothetical protein